MTVELTIGDYLSMAEWYTTLPPAIKELVRRFPPGSKWQVRGRAQAELARVADIPIRQGDYFCPEDFWGDGKIQLRLMSGETAQPLGASIVARPADLIPAGN